MRGRREELQVWRERKGLTRAQCAARLGMSAAAFRRYETGACPPPPAAARTFAAAFRLSPERARTLLSAE